MRFFFFFRNFLDNAEVGLLLSDSLLRQLPNEVAWRADAIICDFLLVAWRKRSPIWQIFCKDGDEWRLTI